MRDHPWQVTLREFTEHVEHVRGLKLKISKKGGALYVQREDGTTAAVLPAISMDEELALAVLTSLCRATGLDPSVTFQTDAEN